MSAGERVTEILNKSFVGDISIRTTTIQEALFIAGQSFSTRDVITVTPATNIYVRFNAGCLNQVVFAPIGFAAAKAGPIHVTYYVNPTYVDATGRTDLTVFNRRGSSTTVNVSAIQFVPAAKISSTGTKFSKQLVASSSGVGALADVGGLNAAGLPFELNCAYEYLIEIDNTNTENADVEYNATWFEIS